jgi:hypothetical protein
MQVDFFGNSVRAETDGLLVSLTDLARAGNAWRALNGLPPKALQAVTESVGFTEFVKVVRDDITDKEVLFSTGKGNKKRTMAHIIIAIYLAEQYSTVFHYNVIKKFVEGQLLEFRELGGTEFKNLNACIDLYLPDRKGKDNKGVYIQCAIKLRNKLLGIGAVAGDWDKSSVAQIHSRYEAEKNLCTFLRMDMIRDYEHLKEIIDRL